MLLHNRSLIRLGSEPCKCFSCIPHQPRARCLPSALGQHVGQQLAHRQLRRHTVVNFRNGGIQEDEEGQTWPDIAAGQESEPEEAGVGLTLVPVRFELVKHCPFGHSFAVVGDVDTLGQWETARAVQLEWADGDMWHTTTHVPLDTPVSFKVIQLDASGEVVDWCQELAGGSNISLVANTSQEVLSGFELQVEPLQACDSSSQPYLSVHLDTSAILPLSGAGFKEDTPLIEAADGARQLQQEQQQQQTEAEQTELVGNISFGAAASHDDDDIIMAEPRAPAQEPTPASHDDDTIATEPEVPAREPAAEEADAVFAADDVQMQQLAATTPARPGVDAAADHQQQQQQQRHAQLLQGDEGPRDRGDVGSVEVDPDAEAIAEGIQEVAAETTSESVQIHGLEGKEHSAPAAPALSAAAPPAAPGAAAGSLASPAVLSEHPEASEPAHVTAAEAGGGAEDLGIQQGAWLEGLEGDRGEGGDEGSEASRSAAGDEAGRGAVGVAAGYDDDASIATAVEGGLMEAGDDETVAGSSRASHTPTPPPSPSGIGRKSSGINSHMLTSLDLDGSSSEAEEPAIFEPEALAATVQESARLASTRTTDHSDHKSSTRSSASSAMESTGGAPAALDDPDAYRARHAQPADVILPEYCNRAAELYGGNTKLVSATKSVSTVDVDAPIEDPSKPITEVVTTSRGGIEPLDPLGVSSGDSYDITRDSYDALAAAAAAAAAAAVRFGTVKAPAAAPTAERDAGHHAAGDADDKQKRVMQDVGEAEGTAAGEGYTGAENQGQAGAMGREGAGDTWPKTVAAADDDQHGEQQEGHAVHGEEQQSAHEAGRKDEGDSGRSSGGGNWLQRLFGIGGRDDAGDRA